jgi:hypothetical protein
MKYEDFCQLVIASLNNERFMETQDCYLCLDDINITMHTKTPGGWDRTTLTKDFHNDHPSFEKLFMLPGFNSNDISIIEVSFQYNGAIIFSKEFYAIAFGSGSGHNICLPTSGFGNMLDRPICKYFTGKVNRDRLDNI